MHKKCNRKSERDRLYNMKNREVFRDKYIGRIINKRIRCYGWFWKELKITAKMALT
jgi:hypothetical protein